MCDVHFNILINDFIEGAFRHFFDGFERILQKLCRRETKALLCDVDRSDLSGEVIQAAEKIAVYLLNPFDRSDFYRFKQRTVKQRIRFCFAFAVDTFVAVCEPFHKTVCLFAWKVLGKFDDTVIIKDVCGVFLPVRRDEFELGSHTTQLTALAFQFRFQVFPVISVFFVIVRTAQHTDDIQHRKPLSVIRFRMLFRKIRMIKLKTLNHFFSFSFSVCFASFILI